MAQFRTAIARSIMHRLRGPATPLLLLVLLALLTACATDEPEPDATATPNPQSTAAAPGDALEMEVLGVAPEGGGGLLILRVKDANELLPVGIGSAEAFAIASKLEEVSPPRPMTHDLLHSVIGSLEGEISYVLITQVVDSAFHAVIVMEHNGRVLEVDARTSDAVALALRAEVPIFASRSVMDEAGIREDDPHVVPL